MESMAKAMARWLSSSRSSHPISPHWLWNGEKFPFDYVMRAIDGAAIGPHGTRGMPVWGD